MTSYETLDELWLDAAHQIETNGNDLLSRDGNSREILGFVGRISNPKAHFMFNPFRRMSPSYAAAEFLWYLSGTSSIEMIKQYAPQYERFSDDGVTAYGAYGKRWKHPEFYAELIKAFPNPEKEREIIDASLVTTTIHHATVVGQLLALISLLKSKPNTRQAILSMWTPGDLVHAVAGDKKDLPCTLNLIFSVRDGKLYLSTNMRSNDIWLGLPYDAFCFMSLQILIADVLNLDLGWYQHSAMSLHVDERNKEKFLVAADNPRNIIAKKYFFLKEKSKNNNNKKTG